MLDRLQHYLCYGCVTFDWPLWVAGDHSGWPLPPAAQNMVFRRYWFYSVFGDSLGAGLVGGCPTSLADHLEVLGYCAVGGSTNILLVGQFQNSDCVRKFLLCFLIAVMVVVTLNFWK